VLAIIFSDVILERKKRVKNGEISGKTGKNGEIWGKRDLSVKGVIEIQNLYERDEEIHRNTVKIYNSASDEFQNVQRKICWV
jgi:hypothetical protein